MTIDLKIYEAPKIIQLADINPGLVLEAPEDAGIISRRSKGNYFGYVRGFISKAIPRQYYPGETIFEELFPRQEERSIGGKVYLDNTFTSDGWDFPKKRQLFLAIGELSNKNEANGNDRHSQFLASDAITLSEEQRNPIIEQLIKYSHKRNNGIYVFRTPDGTEFNLDQIIGGLKQK